MPGRPPPLTTDEVRREVEAVPYWWHSIDVGQGVTTPGAKWTGDAARLRRELDSLHLPALKGCSVLDLGSYDGYYAFEAERRGAARVVAMDHFVWLHDLSPGGGAVDFSLAYLPPDGLPPAAAPLPGKRAFDTAHRLLGSSVESLVADFMNYDVDRLGVFDVVLHLGLLYHMEEPLTALRRVRRVTGRLAVIETEAIATEGLEDRPLVEFVPGLELNSDPTNWWVPNRAALIGLAAGAGFARAEIVDWTPYDEFLPPRPVRRRPIGFRRHVARVRGALDGFRGVRRGALVRGRATLHAWV